MGIATAGVVKTYVFGSPAIISDDEDRRLCVTRFRRVLPFSNACKVKH
jgi:hypothetical protein